MNKQRELLEKSIEWLNRACDVFISEHEINDLIEEIEAELAKPEWETINPVNECTTESNP